MRPVLLMKKKTVYKALAVSRRIEKRSNLPELSKRKAIA